jgi:hypothetical protein
MTVRQGELAEQAARVREAIREELRVSSRGLPFRAWDIIHQGGLLHMTLESDGKRWIWSTTPIG